MKTTVYDHELPAEVRKVRTIKGYAIALRRMMLIFSSITALFGLGWGINYFLGLASWVPALNGFGMAFGGVVAMGIITIVKNEYDRQLKEIQKQYPYLHLDTNKPVDLLVSFVNVREDQKDNCPLCYYTDEEKRALQRKYPSRLIQIDELGKMNRKVAKEFLRSSEEAREIEEQWEKELQHLKLQEDIIEQPDKVGCEDEKVLNSKNEEVSEVEQDPLKYSQLQNLAKELHTLSNKKGQGKNTVKTDKVKQHDSSESVEEMQDNE